MEKRGKDDSLLVKAHYSPAFSFLIPATKRDPVCCSQKKTKRVVRTLEEGLVDKLAVLLGDKHAELSVIRKRGNRKKKRRERTDVSDLFGISRFLGSSW